MTIQLDDQDRAGLSPEELAAIESDDDDQELLREVADDDDDDAATGAAASTAGAADPAAAAAASADAGAGSAAAAPAALDPDADDDAPIIAPAVEGYEQQLEALKQSKAALFKQLMDGDIDPDAYAQKESEVGDQLADLRARQQQHEHDVLRAEKEAERAWRRDCRTFMSDAKQAGIDYEGNRVLGTALDAEVKALANDPKNASRPGKWFLAEADRAVREAFKLGQAQGQAAPAKPAAPAAAATRAGKAPDLSAVAPSIATAPVGAEARIVENEFAYLDKLDGDAQERAIASMKPDVLARYMESI